MYGNGKPLSTEGFLLWTDLSSAYRNWNVSAANPAICRPIASEAVAPGEGALRT